MINRVKELEEGLDEDDALIDLCRYTVSLYDKMSVIKDIIHRAPGKGFYLEECAEKYVEIAQLLAEDQENDGDGENEHI